MEIRVIYFMDLKVELTIFNIIGHFVVVSVSKNGILKQFKKGSLIYRSRN